MPVEECFQLKNWRNNQLHQPGTLKTEKNMRGFLSGGRAAACRRCFAAAELKGPSSKLPDYPKRTGLTAITRRYWRKWGHFDRGETTTTRGCPVGSWATQTLYFECPRLVQLPL